MALNSHWGAASLVWFTGCVSVLAENHFVLKTVIEWSHETFPKAVKTPGFQNYTFVVFAFDWGLKRNNRAVAK